MRDVTDNLKKLIKRRAVVGPVIGHIKYKHHMNNNYLAGKAGCAISSFLAAVEYNFRLLLNWLKIFLNLLMVQSGSSSPFPN